MSKEHRDEKEEHETHEINETHEPIVWVGDYAHPDLGENKAGYNTHGDILFKDECFAIQGAVYEVYRQMGSGFLEAVYQECLERELTSRGIPFYAQMPLELTYKGEKLLSTYRPDLVCYGKIIVEIKALKEVNEEHRIQVYNYLKAAGLRLGLLVNFGHFPKATVGRIIAGRD